MNHTQLMIINLSTRHCGTGDAKGGGGGKGNHSDLKS